MNVASHTRESSISTYLFFCSRMNLLKVFLLIALMLTNTRSEIVITERLLTVPKEEQPTTTPATTSTTTGTTLATTSRDLATEDPRRPNFLTTEEIVTVSSLEDICRLFDVAEKDCTCAEFSNGTIADAYCGKNEQPPIIIISYSPSLSQPYAVVSVVSCIVALLGNGAVIAVKFKRKPTSHSRLLITELAASDSVFAILQLLSVVHLFWTNKWLYGRVMCKVLTSANALTRLYSIGFILLISIERYYGIMNISQAKKISRRLLHTLTAINLLIGFISVVPILMYSDVDPQLNRCFINWPRKSLDSFTYNLYVTIFYFAIPAITIGVLYSRITSYLWRETRNNYALHCGDKTALSRRVADNKRVAYILVAILLAFVVCAFPSQLALLYMDWVDSKVSRKTFFILSYIILIPYPFHYAVNPIIYSLIDKRWRREIWLVLTCTTESQRGIRLSESTKSSRSTSICSAKSNNVRLSSAKDDKGRNLSVDMGTNLLSYQPSPYQQSSSLPSSFKDDVFKF